MLVCYSLLFQEVLYLASCVDTKVLFISVNIIGCEKQMLVCCVDNNGKHDSFRSRSHDLWCQFDNAMALCYEMVSKGCLNSADVLK